MCNFMQRPGGCDSERKLSSGDSLTGGVGWGEVGCGGVAAAAASAAVAAAAAAAAAAAVQVAMALCRLAVW